MPCRTKERPSARGSERLCLIWTSKKVHGGWGPAPAGDRGRLFNDREGALELAAAALLVRLGVDVGTGHLAHELRGGEGVDQRLPRPFLGAQEALPAADDDVDRLGGVGIGQDASDAAGAEG